MGFHTDLIAADLDGIDPQETAGHLRAIAALTKTQLSGMLGWAQHEQDRDVYRVAFELFYQARPDENVVSLAMAVCDQDTEQCNDCGVVVPYDATSYAMDAGRICCGPCGRRRYGDRADEYLLFDADEPAAG